MTMKKSKKMTFIKFLSSGFLQEVGADNGDDSGEHFGADNDHTLILGDGDPGFLCVIACK